MVEQEAVRPGAWRRRARRAVAGAVLVGVVAAPTVAGAAPLVDGWMANLARSVRLTQENVERTRASLEVTNARIREAIDTSGDDLSEYLERIPPIQDWIPLPEPEEPDPDPEPPSDACGVLIPKGDGTDWSCTLNEEFSTGSLDPAVWTAQRTLTSSYTLGGECQVDTPENLSFVDDPATPGTASDHLRLTARDEGAPFTCEASQPDKTFEATHTGATVFSGGKFSQAYGRFEVRAKVPDVTVPGAQFSFWMWREDGNPVGEIDPMEWYSAFPDRGIPTLHGANHPWTNFFCTFDPAKGPWHTYTLEWTPTVIRFLYDGQLCLERTGWSDAMPEPFNTPMMVALTVGLDPQQVEDPATPLPDSWSADIDYVKVWQ